MKKVLAILILLLAIFSLAACDDPDTGIRTKEANPDILNTI